ncbi:TIGR01777 family oxidoreductase [Rubripirellula reticaptiva]|uniref:Epimerase family protein n=1 Tax=Rubripirellula reticaptiva TaxID=2528013 RepID=A0A5C6F4E4_9BACT|nr:TIGR01777 family oxidoreductase [Rubripirellula reticaptiva]TWU56065.1 Epimerase family protein [Rubripirellula reticaptiva]
MSKTETYAAKVSLPVSVDEAFAYHERLGALVRLVPPWESVELEHSDHSLAVGSRVVMKTKILGVPFRWVAEHTQYDPPHLFADTQISGPFASWDHRHEFSSEGTQSALCDQISYQLPMGAVGKLFGAAKARSTIESMFAFRHRLTHDDLQLHADRPIEPMTVAISGSSGLVGNQLSALVTLLGHRARSIVRSTSDSADDIAVWSSDQEASKLGEVDAVVHLAGKSIADQRWTEKVKKEIRDSRVIKTRELCQALAKLDCKPKVLICASATGIYGDRGDEILTEQSQPDDSFLASVAQEWESACQPAVDAGIRVVHARFGVILSPKGGALQKSLLPAKLAGGALGNGKQWWSWIAIDDAVGALYHAITDPALSGPVNFVSPSPITNADFASTLGRVLNRPALFPAPAFALRAALGEMADALLLSSTRAEPVQLQNAGYRFRFDDLELFLRYTLGRDRLASNA